MNEWRHRMRRSIMKQMDFSSLLMNSTHSSLRDAWRTDGVALPRGRPHHAAPLGARRCKPPPPRFP
ncbi:hypothetical protein X946_5414 [Burkholderia sp. ABCPW 111]|nr:hypothetical protein X946_5414 [Burkholderia sp. ABCPW 111]